MPPSEFKENAESLNTAESVQVEVNPSLTRTELDAFASLMEVEIPGTWARSERNALIAAYITAARRLFAEVESRGRAVEALSARLTAKNAELDKVIREAAADKAKAEELARENRVLRLEPSNARFDEVVAEKNQAIDDWYEAAKERDELACKVEAIRRTINPRNPGWKPLSERYPEYFEPDSTEEAARKKGWRQGVDLLTQRIRAALVDPASAPEMPRPPAEEGPTEEQCAELIVGLLFGEPGTANETAQEPVSGPETTGTGSGRGTGVTEAQASDG